jgi:hypothetical protein
MVSLYKIDSGSEDVSSSDMHDQIVLLAEFVAFNKVIAHAQKEQHKVNLKLKKLEDNIKKRNKTGKYTHIFDGVADTLQK